MTEPHEALAGLWAAAGGDAAAPGRVALTGRDPVLPSPYRVGTAAAVSIAAAGLAASELWRLRTGEAQRVSVAMRDAAAAFRGERLLRIDGAPPPDPWSPLAGYYETGDGGWIQLHTNFPHHRDGVLRRLDVPPARDAVAAAIRGWRGAALEDALAADGMCAGLMRTPEDWRRHPQGRAVARLPLIEIRRIGAAPPEPFPAAPAMPLGGLRVLDLTRIIAGPVAGRTLADYGAEVLMVTAPHLPSIETTVIETGRGKRAAALDLRRAADAARLRALAGGADVFLQAYRPSTLARRGFGPEALAALRPGLVYVTLSAYGHEGPWAERRGFDSLVQTVSGIVATGTGAAGSDRPRPLPAQALDHATGYLAACGAMIALARRAREGGSWLVRVALAATAHWLDGLGRVEGGLGLPDPGPEAFADRLETVDSAFGRLACVRPAAVLSRTPIGPTWPSVPLGGDPPRWIGAGQPSSFDSIP